MKDLLGTALLKSKPFWAAVLLLLSSGFSVLVFEVALRAPGYNPLRALNDGREQILRPSAHPLVRYELIPGASGRAWGARVEINAHGFRGPDVAPSPRPEYRILVLGDSITFGNFLGVEETFSSQLQGLLNAGSGDYQLLNFGVGGYDTLQEVALLATRGLEYRPDLVIVAYCLNDIGIVSTNLAFAEKLEARAGNPLFRLRSVRFVMDRIGRLDLQGWTTHKNSREVFRLEYAEEIDAIDDDEDGLLALMNGVFDEYPSAWYRSRDRVGRLRFALGWLADLSNEEGFSVLVAIIPWLVADASGYPHAAAHRIVGREARRAGFDVLDLTEPFMEAGIEGLRRAPSDWMHPDEVGHSIIAEALESPVRERADARRR